MKKWFNRQTGVKSVYLLLCAVAVILVVLVNLLGDALAQRYPLQIDLTATQVFGLDAATQDYLQTLQQPITIQVLATEERFTNTSTYNAQANEIMQQFAKQSSNITIEYIDYVQDPTYAANYPELTMKHGDIMVKGENRYKLVKTEELFNYTSSQSGSLSIVSSRAEQSILSAILYVVSDEVPLVAIITGHNERDTSSFAAILQQNNFDVQTVQLSTQEIPAEADIVLLAAPKNDLSVVELAKLDAFLDPANGRKTTLLYCADAEQSELPHMETFLAEWGVQYTTGAVFETDEGRVYNYHPFYTIVDYVDVTYAAMLRSATVPMLMPLGRPMEILFAAQGNITTQELLAYGSSTGVRPVTADSTFTADDSTRNGPMPALVRCDNTIRNSNNATVVEGRGTVLASASAAMLDSDTVGTSAFSNAEYLVNVLNDLCSREDTISVPSKSLAGQSLNITQQQADQLGVLFVFLIPAAVLIFGFALWLLRRHK